MIRIVIADPQVMLRELLRGLLEQQGDFTVLAETDDGLALPDIVSTSRPDILLIDLHLRKRPGLDVLRSITPDSGVKPIIFADSISPSEAIQALVSGARGIVRKDAPMRLLFESMRRVMEGEYWISRHGVADLVSSLRELATAVERSAEMQDRALSPRQRQIVDAIASGCSNKEIAETLHVSERTVKYHLTRIFSKYGVSGRMELARYSLKNRTALGA
jgi:DNA-binding NarL/FixJ family response regulator